ncbi:hypothetical protein H257_06549 [Aphanomyces astaci]|uniref:Uncharacterized protein n=1 Tax=Aphanomyces astaci TaxID=112090 RepID=W4GKH5_APHAT|nr:hypothetical protein H257_06549 [Aphanomyces astaci]ETV80190.1 hypothetical protein H257_06549 [Aphanomyces astaci]|eukprot:XP_009830114.1 hypothetical protein H257_06549 [Aphanomyces astaci]
MTRLLAYWRELWTAWAAMTWTGGCALVITNSTHDATPVSCLSAESPCSRPFDTALVSLEMMATIKQRACKVRDCLRFAVVACIHSAHRYDFNTPPSLSVRMLCSIRRK